MIYVKDGKRINIHAPVVINDVQYPNLVDASIRESLGIVAVQEPEAPEDFSYDTYTRNEIDISPYVVYERKPQAEIDALMLAKAKQRRAEEVTQIVVTTSNGMTFDGHEDAQNRMARAITGMEDTDEILWVLADNTPARVSKAELKEALRLAGQAQTELWIKPYV